MTEDRKGGFKLVRKPTMLQKVMREAHARSITPANKKLLDAAKVVRLDPGTKDDAAFVHVVMCHLGMPRSKTAERVFERAYERPNFRCGLRLEAGNLWNGHAFEEHPLPYGVKPRIAFMHLLTTAIKTKAQSALPGGRSYFVNRGNERGEQRTEERLPTSARIVYEFEESKINGEPFLRYASMRA